MLFRSTNRVAALEARTNAWNRGITNEVDTLATVLARGNNGNQKAVTNLSLLRVSDGASVGAGNMEIYGSGFDFYNGASYAGGWDAAAGRIYNNVGDIIIWTSIGGHSALDGTQPWHTLSGLNGRGHNWTNANLIQSRSIRLGDASDIITITGYAAFSNLVQAIINANP